MSYEGMSNLNELETATPLDGASVAEMALAIRQLKSIVKNVILTSMRPNGTLRGVAADSILGGSVGTSQLVDDAVTAAKLAALAVVTDALADSAVTTPKLANGAVTAAKLAENSVVSTAFADNSIPLRAFGTPLSGDQISRSSTTDAIRAISTNHLRDGAVTDEKVTSVSVEKLTGGEAGQIMVRTADGWEPIAPAGDMTFNPLTGAFTFANVLKAARLGDVKTRGSSGGATLANTWMTRDLGELTDTEDLLDFTGNSFKLIPGRYLVSIRCPSHGAVGKHQARLLRDNGDSTLSVVLWGTSEVGVAGQSGVSVVEGLIEEDGASGHSYRVEHWFENAIASDGLGKAASSGDSPAYDNHVEVYTLGYIARI